jgi:two-component system, chemotaxis family, chemotaxis protein CheY
MVVMVVEDSSTMRQLICHALRRIDGIVLLEASDGAHALQQLGEIRPDVVLTDLNMPNMDGFGLIEAMRARDDLKSVPVIILTTEGALPDKSRADELQVATFVTKPIKPDAVVAAVKRVFETMR